MDSWRFDDLTRSLAAAASRRGLVATAAALGAALLGTGSGRAQVSSNQCGDDDCKYNPAVCNPGCVCCVFPNGNVRCRPPGDCPGVETCQQGWEVDPVRGCVRAGTTVATPVPAVPTVPPLDLAAMALTPADVEMLGFGGYAVAGGRIQTGRERAVDVAGTDAINWDLQYARVGRVLFYRSRLARPTAPGEMDYDAVMDTEITQFSDDEHAEREFDILIQRRIHPRGRPLPEESSAVGDRGFVFDTGTATLPDGSAHPAVALFVRVGTVVATVETITPSDRVVSRADIEAIGARLVERIRAVQADGGPGLGIRVLRWARSRYLEPEDDRYLMLGSEPVAGLGETDDAVATADEEYRGAIDRYRYVSYLTLALMQLETIARFPSDEEADAWVRGAIARANEDQPTGMSVSAEEDMPTLGDASVVVKAHVTVGDYTLRGYMTYIRLGDCAINLCIAAFGTLDVADVLAMAEAQVACFVAGNCTGPRDLPPGLDGL